MADWLTVISALIVVVGFLTLSWFIHRLGLLEENAMFRPVMQPSWVIPSERVFGVRNPFQVKFKPVKNGMLQFCLNSSLPCYGTMYWGVDKKTIDNSTRLSYELSSQHNDCDDDLFDDDDDDDGEDNKDDAIDRVTMEKLLAGSYETKSVTEFFCPGKDHKFTESIPEAITNNDSQYPLVLAVETSRIDVDNRRQTEKSYDIVTLLCVFHHQYNCLSRLEMFMQYIQTADGRVFPLKKLFVNEEEEPIYSPPETPLSQQRSTHGTCIICQNLPVTRALLPCRHACVCGSCFSRLGSMCPLCRQVIRSYFLTQEEPNFVDTLDTSRDMNKMSTLELIRGIFSAS
ncbi:cell growth regulator with RING finger domain protein 1 isoform X1 [Nematostella vectensis]|uniref:cell growth regulator with RING finger domain protein 1 isoform X1 n=1 Tax=Nematostella vectensis TaxID=45351 RepID=UPI002076F7FB|nr:cell growth regulator with RING finger domain protein 1 isoform X1 [Nematostella vectensis]